MGYYCSLCARTWLTHRGFQDHLRQNHRNQKPPPPDLTFRFHNKLNALPCDEDGNFLADNTPPPPRSIRQPTDWSPFENRPAFEYAEYAFEKIHTSVSDLNTQLNLWAAYNLAKGHDDTMFSSHHDVLTTIDEIPLGDLPWSSFNVRYTGPADGRSPSWKHQVYTVHTRNTFAVQQSILQNEDFVQTFDYVPYEAYTESGDRQWCNLLSGHWAWKQSDEIAKDPATHGAMFCPIVLGADKTTVSTATGHSEFHPVYMSNGNLHNTARRGHRDAVIPIAFLAIPKSTRDAENTDEFRTFKKQLYHASLTHILEPLRLAMSIPHVMKCPDRHFRRVIFEIGPFIANYPEQVVLTGIVNRWCPKCFASSKGLHACGQARFRAFTNTLIEFEDDDTLWDAFGIDPDILPFTSNFPRADIHELISPDILHQVIKGTFKDHLVLWVETFIKKTNPPRVAVRILADIDRRIAAVPSFPGLRRFPEGRRFTQWTGNDSKALMKVYLPAITGHVPDAVVQCVASFMDFCYLVRRPSHTTSDFARMQHTLDRFWQLRQVFEEYGIRPNGFCLPRQHSLLHYIPGIKLFGSPNGLCSSITESKHITAVKKPWRASSRHDSLKEILDMNVRDILMSIRVARGLAPPTVDVPLEVAYEGYHGLLNGEDEATGDDGPRSDVITRLATTHAYVATLTELADNLDCPALVDLCRRFLYDQIYSRYDPELDSEYADIDDCPLVDNCARVFTSALSVFYAPNSWREKFHRRDTVLIQINQDLPGFEGMFVGRICTFLEITSDDLKYPCALIQWFDQEDTRDSVTGMWVVEPELDDDGLPLYGIVSLDTITIIVMNV
ncbi:hypothetical protein NLI96_g12846 [Meripilus lineatus]|uniref:C2H2-type domain-containing protein n=1 Tax=Meripilus lineatus TaxID=2056292 RepID=A0AAD5Y9H7_9APHY|nr:hypothetical protein NLI96_g12846 [Physisporinus lineatus]